MVMSEELGGVTVGSLLQIQLLMSTGTYYMPPIPLLILNVSHAVNRDSNLRPSPHVTRE